MHKKLAFTLAEVLITLGIIGVVAAMSIPTLIANTNSAKFSSQFKKSIATLNQAALMSQAQYDFDFAGADSACSDDGFDDPKTLASVCALLNGTLAGGSIKELSDNYNLNNNGIYTSDIVHKEGMIAYQMADGSMFVFPKATKSGCTVEPGQSIDDNIWNLIEGGCYGYIDVNNTSMPNTEVNCGDYSIVTTTPSSPCLVAKNSAQMTDIYPVVYHDGVVQPATNAASYVLSGGSTTKQELLIR